MVAKRIVAHISHLISSVVDKSKDEVLATAAACAPEENVATAPPHTAVFRMNTAFFTDRRVTLPQ